MPPLIIPVSYDGEITDNDYLYGPNTESERKFDFGTHDQPQAEPPPTKPPQPVPIYYLGGYKTCHHGHVTAKKYHEPVWKSDENDILRRVNLTSRKYTLMSGTHKEPVNGLCCRMYQKLP